MATINSCFLFPNSYPVSPKSKPVKNAIPLHPSLPSCSVLYGCRSRILALPAVASVPYEPINMDYLESEFSGHGVTFTGIHDSCVIRMALENGSVTKIMLPSGLITSYKAPMWHGGTMELLHTSVSEAENGNDAVIEGGVSLAIYCKNDEGTSWSPDSWILHEVNGSPHEIIQVKLVSRNPEGTIEVHHTVTLEEDVLSSDITVSNATSSPLALSGSVISHLTVSTPDATYAMGLEGSNFFTSLPFLTDFSVIPPDFGNSKDQGSKKFWGSAGSLMDLLSSWTAEKKNDKDDGENMTREAELLEGEEDDDYKHLGEEMSRIYTSAPRKFTVIDRGRRNSVIIGREGFKELYLLSPGSRHKWYGKYSYVCIGQAALRDPIILDSQGEWRGGQHLHNPNW